MSQKWHNWSLDDLALFAEVARQGHFAHAAVALRMSASTLSRRVARLEDAVGVQLLVRTTRKVALTEAGRALAAAADGPLSELQSVFEGELWSSEGPFTGRLRVAASTVAGRDTFGPLLLDFVRHHPQLRLEIRLGNANLDLVEEEIDFAFRLGPLPDSELIARRIQAIEYRLYASEAFVAAHLPEAKLPSLEALRDLPCVVVPPMTTWPFRSLGSSSLRRIRPVATDRLEDLVLGLRAVEAGRGVGCLPAGLTSRERRGSLSTITIEGWAPVERGMYLVHPPATHLAPKVRAAIDHVLEVMALRSSAASR